MEKAQLLSEMQRCYHEWNSLLATLTSEELLLPGVAGAWSVKDVVAHLTAWLELAFSDISAAREGREPLLSFDAMSKEELEELNQRFHRERQGQTLEEVLTNFHTTWRRLYDETMALDDKLLQETAQLVVDWQARPLGELIYGETCEHLVDHTNALRAWLSARHGSGSAAEA
ncbi:MAG: ClbS/DfsB family four-helix bundle protein [Thermogemmatispora sp.]|uniref:ClbS/DfsB family four-helix bundle protein n=1 Tax=Thermogemmatispora sp. TaxID=1968838 RepID=UPI00260BD388|nr:ClbS/DfsB family four-helix bundle protein [Thermogemmatispora sp.]MBX5459005.1 ClbS/DfsB family four-helix bundle protein [Thermogemmatispora sp.]